MTVPGPLVESPIVSTQWLADHLGAARLVVLDATVLPYRQPNGRGGNLSGHETYLLNGHIPGALFADLIETFSDPKGGYPFTRPSADAFASAAGAHGIDNETTVIVYDNALGQWAARLWWLFRAFGHDRVAVLDGGFKRWVAETRPTDIGHVEPTPAVFTAVERPGLWADKAEVEAIVAGTAPGALVCGIPPKEFAGEEGNRPRLGHIPGSVSAPVGRLIDRDTNTLLKPDELSATFATVPSDGRVVAYCHAGIAASADALALTLLGHHDVAIYDGSLSEWAADADAPLTASV
jgi:thiosulfate/3-mercaptopyruvate sulfurtransferase